MSIYKTYSKNDPIPDDGDAWVERETHPFFYCGKALDADPAIEWLGRKAPA